MWIDGDVSAGFRRRNIACGFHMMKEYTPQGHNKVSVSCYAGT
jgi:hypothetical protein